MHDFGEPNCQSVIFIEFCPKHRTSTAAGLIISHAMASPITAPAEQPAFTKD